MEDAALHLRREFVELINRPLPQPDEPAEPPRWLEVWTLFAEDEWFTDVVEDCAGIMLRNRGLPGEWQDEVVQKAMFILGRKLRKNFDLDFDQ